MRIGAEKFISRVEMAGISVVTALSRLPLSWRGVGALIVGALLARWTWILFAPNTLSVFPSQSNAGGKVTEALFGVPESGGGVNSNANAKLGNVQLVGIFTGKHGFAVLKLDEKSQRGFALGDEVIKGTKLVAVNADYVLLEHDGVTQKLNLEVKEPKNKESVVMEQPESSTAVAQAVAGWNQASQKLQHDRNKLRMEKMKEMHK
jgi:type II secretory pathway component PulC